MKYNLLTILTVKKESYVNSIRNHSGDDVCYEDGEHRGDNVCYEYGELLKDGEHLEDWEHQEQVSAERMGSAERLAPRIWGTPRG